MTDKYLTVSALTKYIKRKIDTDIHLKNIWLKGEISNFNHHSRGHMYLTLKDNQTRIQAVMFRGHNRRLKFRPENGMHVLVRGEVSVFEAYGQYQLYIQEMEPDGIGSLYLAFEQLKEELRLRGYFDTSRKRAIPNFPRHIGIITSPTGAAIRDILTTLKRRYPIVNITVIPTIVQGKSAPDSIKNAIERANQLNLFDVLIIGRGGGSIEDLWGFNEKIVAQAIFDSQIPTISAIGHETDFTISDYVADLRAPTPTGAAELAVPSQLELKEKIESIERSLTHMLKIKIANHHQHLKRLKQSYAFRYPGNLIRQKEQELDHFTERLNKANRLAISKKKDMYQNLLTRLSTQHPKRQFVQAQTDLENVTRQLNNAFMNVVTQKSQRLTASIDKLTLLNPLEIMKRGFAIPYSENGAIIKSSHDVRIKETLSLQLSDGTLHCQVLDVKENMNDDRE